MRSVAASVMLGGVLILGATLVHAQPRPGTPPAPAQPAVRPGDEIRLDETTALKASALEARMSALLANFALLQRQAQDMQQEMQKMLEERKGLIEGAARRMNVDAKDPNEWVLDTKGQRYIRQQRPVPGAQAPQR